MTYRGLTWDHPRGYNALAEAARRINASRAEPLLVWEKQTLEGFESAPIAELASRYDLLVIDHPHVGEAVDKDCLHAFEDLFDPDQIAAWDQQSVGPSLASYQLAGRTWALPLDVATQVMARRADTLRDPPQSYREIIELAKKVPVAQSLAGPHALLTFFSVIAGLGGRAGDGGLMCQPEAEQALSIMHELYRVRSPGTEALNPIALSEALLAGDLALVPLIFGYVNYAKSTLPTRIAFTDTIGVRGPQSGGVLGGTGLALSKRCKPTPTLLQHVADLMTPGTQRDLFAAFDGQPSARTVWTDKTINGRWGNFYQDCLATAERAFVRPRFHGYVRYQTLASQRLREALEASEPETKTLHALRMAWAEANALAPVLTA
ncbi:MAG: extracellular solute-binding protein [Pseudomonadota bacterium]